MMTTCPHCRTDQARRVTATIGQQVCKNCLCEFNNTTPANAAAQGTDPKATAAKSKTRLDLIPPAASKACADAFAFGAITKGYGTWNWRKSEGVAISTYVAAAKRHLDDLMEGEDCAPDSGIHHAGHIMAGMAIVLDALKHGKLIDDRVLVKKP